MRLLQSDSWVSRCDRHDVVFSKPRLDSPHRPKPPVKFDHFSASPAARVLPGKEGRLSMGHPWILVHATASKRSTFACWQLGVTMWQAWRCVFNPRLDCVNPLHRPKPPVKLWPPVNFDHFSASPAARVLPGKEGRLWMGHPWILFHATASIWQLGVTMWQAWRCVFETQIRFPTPPKTAREIWPFFCLSRRQSSAGQGGEALDGSPVNSCSCDCFKALYIRMLTVGCHHVTGMTLCFQPQIRLR